MKNFQKHFEIIFAKYSVLAREQGTDARDIHKRAFADFLGVSQGKMQAWQKGQWPAAEDLAKIAANLGFSYQWLVAGQGEPEGEADFRLPPARAALPTKASDARIAELEAEVGRLKDRLLELYQEQVQAQERYMMLLHEAHMASAPVPATAPVPAPGEPLGKKAPAPGEISGRFVSAGATVHEPVANYGVPKKRS